MKKLIIFALFCTFFLPSVFAYCEYIDVEKYTEFEIALCLEGSNTFYAEALIISDFVNGSRASFTVTNPNSFQVKAFFNYSIQGHLNKEKFYGITINGKDKKVIQDLCFSDDIIGNCSINKDNVQYFITEPRRSELCITDIPRTREIINKPCQKDSDCSQAVCNIAGFCGKDKVPPCCPDGRTNCNDIACLTPSIKLGGEAYLCEWECRSGIGVKGVCKDRDGKSCQKDTDCLSGTCNIIKQCGSEVVCPVGTKKCENLGCFSPSTKRYGKAYKCEWECKSQSGKDGICQPSTTTIIIFIVFTLIVISVGTWYFAIYKRKKVLADTTRLKEERKKLSEAIENFNNEISDLNNKVKDSKQEIDSLNEKKKNAEGDAKREFDEKLKEEEQNYKTRLDDLKNKYNSEMNFYAKKLEFIDEETTRLKEKQKKWREKAKNAKGEAKKKLDGEYELLKKESENLEKLEQNIEERQIAASNKKKDVEKLEEETKKHSFEAYIHKQTEKYNLQYGGRSGQVYYDPESKNLKIKFKDGPERFLHRHIYYTKFGLKKNEEVHHIDNDHLNNELWNLIALPEEKHDNYFVRFHSKLEKGNWELGIEVLKNELNMKDDDFPEHIRTEIKKRKEQKKLTDLK